MAEKVNKFDRDWWVNHRERALQNKWYAIGRIDLLVVSISGGGIYIIFEAMKFIIENKLATDVSLLKTSGVIFTISIALNFVSQVFGWNANKYEAKWSKFKIDESRKKPIDAEEVGKVDFKVSICNWCVAVTNNLSIIGMLAGVVILLVFNYSQF